MEAERDSAAGVFELRFLVGDGPRAAKTPLVRRKRRRNRILVLAIADGRRREVLRAVVAEVRFGRLHRVIGRERDAADIGLHGVGSDMLRARLGEELLDDRLGFGVLAFAEMMMANAALRID